jgi:peptidoglycan hydrolase-like protein with peptidoglycan-binding domain
MVRRVLLAVGGAVLLLGASADASAATTSTTPTTPTATVRWDAGDDAPSIGLIGDSTLSGVRWVDEYGDLRQFTFLFDAESCRRTLETSCWSREQYRPRTAITALEDHAGEWGDVLVMMTGYNDSGGSFTDGVDAIVDEARDQGIETVVWLSLRTKGVDYEEPLHLANGSTYREANRSLYELAADSGGTLQIADWATHSAEYPEWFEADGAHLAPAGVEPLTDFIADQVDVVLAGGTVTPDPMPWEEVREGDDGDLVVEVQEALLGAGIDDVEVADGLYGPQTGDAVVEFQQRAGLPETGAVDHATAVELGLSSAIPVTTTTVAPTTTVATSVPRTTAAATGVTESADQDGSGFGTVVWWGALPIVAGLAVFARRRPRAERPTPSPPAMYDHEHEPTGAVSERA